MFKTLLPLLIISPLVFSSSCGLLSENKPLVRDAIDAQTEFYTRNCVDVKPGAELSDLYKSKQFKAVCDFLFTETVLLRRAYEAQ